MANMFGDIMQNGSPLAADPSSGYYQGPDGTWYYQGQLIAGSGPGSGNQPQLPASVQMAAAPGSVVNPITGATASDPSAPGSTNRTGPVTAVHGGTSDSGGTASAGNVGQPVVPSAPIVSGGPASIPAFSGVNYPTFTPPPLPDSLQKQFTLPTANDLITNDPGYMARYQQGVDATQRSAAAQGTLLSGGQLKALTNYGQDYASGEYNNYVNQLLSQRNQQANDYLSLAYGPAWQQNQGAVNQYGQLYGQYKDLLANNRNAQNDYISALLQQQQIGANSAGAPPTSSTSNV